MTAADNLTRWSEAEQAAAEGPWESSTANRRRSAWVRAAGGHMVDHYIRPEDAEFIATSRTAVPALLAFAEAVLAYSKPPWDETIIGTAIRDLAEQHLGGVR